MPFTTFQKTLIALASFVVLGTFTRPWTEEAQLASTQSRKHIPTCSEVGLCKKGERHLLLSTRKNWSSTVVKDAYRKGCKTKGSSRSHIRFLCPLSVTLPFAHEERVFRLHDLVSNTQIGATDVQRAGVTGKGVVVAVLDTGVDAGHPELRRRIIAQANFTTDTPEDVVGHGTHVAGIIAGQGTQERENANRALGASPDAQLIVGKVCNNQGWCLEGDLQAGIEWAMRQRARVINLSLGGGSFVGHCDDDPLAEEANWAAANGVIVVAAAGNSGEGGEGIATPACGSSVIAVGAVDAADARPSWSSFGAPLDVVAPGVGILSPIPCAVAGTCPDAGYAQWSGTSMAAPHVAGVAALLLEQEPSLTPLRMSQLLAATAKDVGAAGTDALYGAGRIDVAAAFQRLWGGGTSSSASSISQSSLSSESVSSEQSKSSVQSSSESSAQRSSNGAVHEEEKSGEEEAEEEKKEKKKENDEDEKHERHGPPPHAQNRKHEKKEKEKGNRGKFD